LSINKILIPIMIMSTLLLTGCSDWQRTDFTPNMLYNGTLKQVELSNQYQYLVITYIDENDEEIIKILPEMVGDYSILFELPTERWYSIQFYYQKGSAHEYPFNMLVRVIDEEGDLLYNSWSGE